MSSSLPATIEFSLDEFARHGGLGGQAEDGWGVAFYQGKDVFLVREAKPAENSDCIRVIRKNKITSRQVIAHIRGPVLYRGHRVLWHRRKDAPRAWHLAPVRVGRQYQSLLRRALLRRLSILPTSLHACKWLLLALFVHAEIQIAGGNHGPW